MCGNWPVAGPIIMCCLRRRTQNLLKPYQESSAPNHGKNQPRRTGRVVEDGLLGAPQFPALGEHGPGVRIPIEPREVAARDLQTDSVSGRKEIARRADVD